MNTTAEQKLAYTYAEAGQIIGLSARSIWSLVATGKLRAAKIGRSVRIPRAEIERFLAAAQGVKK